MIVNGVFFELALTRTALNANRVVRKPQQRKEKQMEIRSLSQVGVRGCDTAVRTEELPVE
jgi:hypothetical protein